MSIKNSRTRHDSAAIAFLLLAPEAWICIDGREYSMEGKQSVYAFLVRPGKHTISSNTYLYGPFADVRRLLRAKTAFTPVTLWLAVGDALGYRFYRRFGKQGLKPAADRSDEIWTGLATLDAEHLRAVS
jgi:hypothetical protein